MTTAFRSIWLAPLAGTCLGMTQVIPGAGPLAIVALLPLMRFLSGRASVSVAFSWITLYALTAQLLPALTLYKFGWINAIGIGVACGTLLAVFLLPLCLLVSVVRHTRGAALGALVVGWLSYELLQQTWALSLPLFTMGSSLVDYPRLIQWYAVTGTAGGTGWLLLASSLLNDLLLRRNLSVSWRLILVILLPVLTILSPTAGPDNEQRIPVAVLHPDLDVREERQRMNALATSEFYADLVQQALVRNPDVELIVAPENALPNAGWISQARTGVFSNELRPLREALAGSTARLLIGGFLYQDVSQRPPDPADNYTPDGNNRFLAYNTILEISSDTNKIVRIKDRLVPFEEFPVRLFEWTVVPRVGATGFYLSRSSTAQMGGHLICYESLFSLETAAMVRNHRPNVLTVHLNEGWYDTRLATRQFARHGVARAIETGKDIVRSSNRGSSEVIGFDGRVRQQENRRQVGVLSGYVNHQKRLTPYVSTVSRLYPYLIWPTFLFFWVWSIWGKLTSGRGKV